MAEEVIGFEPRKQFQQVLTVKDMPLNDGIAGVVGKLWLIKTYVKF